MESEEVEKMMCTLKRMIIQPTEADLVSIRKMSQEIALRRHLQKVKSDKLTSISIHLLTCMCLNDLIEARYVWKQIPQRDQSNPTLKGIHEILVSLWKQNTNEAMRLISHLYMTLHAETFALTPLVDLLKKCQVEVILQDLTKTFSTVSCTLVGKHLGVTAEEAESICTEHGWSVTTSNTTKYLVPVQSTVQRESLRRSHEDQLATLTQCVSFLERFEYV